MTARKKSRWCCRARSPNLLANGSQGIAVGMATSIPPHNAAELCDAALHLIDHPNAKSRKPRQIRPRPGLPDRAASSSIRPPRSPRPMSPARGSFRVRARWTRRRAARGTWQVVITEIPWLVQKSRLVEKLAELINDKNCRWSATSATSTAEDLRLVIEPRARTVDAELMMESLFKLTELESRIPLNMNVLVGGKVPKVARPCRSAARLARPSPATFCCAAPTIACGRSMIASRCWAAISSPI